MYAFGCVYSSYFSLHVNYTEKKASIVTYVFFFHSSDNHLSKLILSTYCSFFKLFCQMGSAQGTARNDNNIKLTEAQLKTLIEMSGMSEDEIQKTHSKCNKNLRILDARHPK